VTVNTPTFNEMVNAAIKVETKKKAMDNEGHKRGPNYTGYG
jgi:hypothetical protein